MTRLLILAALLMWPSAASATDIPLLRDVICDAWETRGLADPDNTPGRDGEIGRCQIKAWSAIAAGYRGRIADLWEPGVNRAWALEILRQCRARWGWRVSRLAHCYNQGPRAPYAGPTRYTKGVGMLYAMAVMARHKERLWPLLAMNGEG